MTDMVEKVWRAIAIENGDNPDQVPKDKADWNANRGQFAGRSRDINEPFVLDYEDMARAAIRALMEPTDKMLTTGRYQIDHAYSAPMLSAWQAMLKAALDD